MHSTTQDLRSMTTGHGVQYPPVRQGTGGIVFPWYRWVDQGNLTPRCLIFSLRHNVNPSPPSGRIRRRNGYDHASCVHLENDIHPCSDVSEPPIVSCMWLIRYRKEDATFRMALTAATLISVKGRKLVPRSGTRRRKAPCKPNA